jgi:RimJ/RimL family protein N-acetyltransferase
MGHPLWPLFDLALRTERLELRLPTDDELPALVEVSRDIHPPEEMPFGVAFTDVPSPAFERESARHHWRGRANWSADRWDLNLAVFLDGRPIAALSLHSESFPVLRQVGTGSWVGRGWQGRGFGKEMRAAGLTLAFEGLGAEVATSSAFLDNHASNGVSRALGYEPDGLTRLAPRGVARELQRWRMTREAWFSRPRPAVRIEGLEQCLDMFGLPPA